jgi:hypothetical protein
MLMKLYLWLKGGFTSYILPVRRLLFGRKFALGFAVLKFFSVIELAIFSRLPLGGFLILPRFAARRLPRPFAVSLI